MTRPATATTVTRAELTDGHWSHGILTVRFAPDAFAAAGALLEIAQAKKVHWSVLACYDERLNHAFTEKSWPDDDRTFYMRQWLGEDPASLDRFMTEVLPHLELSFVGPEVDRHDPRLSA
jgi:hypothetical protein